MFKRSKRKIVVSIMAILVLLFLGALTIIYGSSYFEVSTINREMLERYAELYSIEKQFADDVLPGKRLVPDIPDPGPDDLIKDADDFGFEDTPKFKLSTFYSVAVSDDGGILAVNNGIGTVYGDEELQKYAEEIIESKKTGGIKDSLLYTTAEKEGYTLVAFMDNTVMRQSMTTLFRYTLVFGSITIIALFFVAVRLADRIVKPLEESYQKQKQFISDASHELKTPISVISANAELLSREIGDNRWLANIEYENERMGRLVCQLLELARTESVARQTEYLDVSRLVSGEMLPFESVAFEQGILLNSEIENGLFTEENGNQLRQLVSILLDNAIRHGRGGRDISLILKEEHGFAKLSVINDGSEIPPEQREKLFERFYRADAARNSDDRHYGLGLAIAKAIVTAHKGKINVLCYDGKVEFTVRIPLKK